MIYFDVKVSKSWLIPLLAIYSVFSANAQDIPRSYVAYKANEVIVIDGKIDENAWKLAPWSEDYIDIEGKLSPTYKTRMKMLWDNEYLYVMAEMEEPHIWATLKQRDTVIFYNNDFEIFIDAEGDTHNYYEFEMNAHNTVWDLFLTKPYRNNGKVIDSWDIQGVRSAVDIRGTLNNPTDTDEGWTVEIALPWSVITEASKDGKIPINDFWRLNFSRVNWDFDLTDGRYSRKKDGNGNYLPEYNWVWSPQGVINMHEPEHWGYVYFSSEQAGSNVEFTIPKDDHIKWHLYSLFRSVLHKEKDAEKRIAKPKKILGYVLRPTMEKHLSGYNIWVKSPFTNKILMVKEDGQFLSFEEKGN